MFAFDQRQTLPFPSFPPSAMDYTAPTSVQQVNGAAPSPPHRHMWIITGPAGCGKSTVAQYLAKELSIPYIEGDDVSGRAVLHSWLVADRASFHPQYHSETNKQKMAHDIPLTDIDRWDWLITLREAAAARLSPSGSSATKAHDGVVVTCSALKRKYRDVIRIAAYNNHSILVHFIYLRADEATLMARVLGRTGHYMKSAMVHSQMEALEEPDKEEQGRDVLELRCDTSLAEVQKLVVRTVRQVLANDAGHG